MSAINPITPPDAQQQREQQRVQREQFECELAKCTLSETPRYDMNGYRTIAKCVDVYDGDTVTLAFIPKSMMQFYSYRVRLNGIDTPEIRTTDANEKDAGLAARDYLRSLIADKLVYVVFSKFDKYGRLLGDLYLDEAQTQYINKMMIDKGYAYEYYGGSRRRYANNDKQETDQS